MTTTATTATNKTADCIVTYGEDWIEVQSPSGKRVRIDVVDYPNTWDAFTFNETTLFDRLTAKPSGSRVLLSYQEMKTFAAAAARANEEQLAPKPEKPPIQGVPFVAKPSDVEIVAVEPLAKKSLEAVKVVKEVKEVAQQTITRTEAGMQRYQEHRSGGRPISPDFFAAKKLTLKDAGDIEKRIRGLEKVERKVNEGLSMLIYDIPTELNEQCPNPSGFLWGYGFRLNLSCWVLPQSSLDSPGVQDLLRRWREVKPTVTKDEQGNVVSSTQYHVETHIIPYAREAIVQIREIARNKLAEEIRRVHTALVVRLSSASERMEAAEKELGDALTEKEQSAIQKRRDNEARSLLKLTAEALVRAVKCAEIFDDTGSTKTLLLGLREALIAETQSFNLEARAKGIKPAIVVK